MSGPAIDVVFSLDSTLSMEPCTAEVKQHLQSMVTRLRQDIPSIRIAVIAHGDFPTGRLDASFKFIIKIQDFTNDAEKLRAFISGLENTNGGDLAEAYELALQKMSTLSWSSRSQKVAVVIGDEVPHEPGSDRDVEKIDWRAEVVKLVSMGVKIHGVQCLNNSSAESFYRHLADKSGGRYLRLRDFDNIRDLMMAVCYREQSVRAMEGYEQEVKQRGGPLNANMEEIFAALRQ